MERMTPAEEVQEDIDINTKEGLQAFSRYTEDAYSELIEHAKSHSSESSHELLEKASRLYEAIKGKLDSAFALKDEGGDVDETLAEEIQTHYNELLDILDGVETEAVVIQEEIEVAPEAAPVTEEVDTEELITPESQPAKIPVFSFAQPTPKEPVVIEVAPIVEEVEVEPAPVIEEVKQPEIVQEEKKETATWGSMTDDVETATEEPAPENITTEPVEAEEIEESEVAVEESLVIDEGKTIEKGTLNELQEKTEALIEQAESLLAKYQEITEVVSSDVVLNVGQHYYKQLGATTERARGTLKNIKSHLEKDDKVTELVAEHLEDTVDEIADNLIQLDKGLGGFFEKEEEVSLLDLDTKKQTTGAIEVAKEEESEEKVVPITLVKKPEPEPEPKKGSQPQAIYNSPSRPSTERVERVFKTEWGGTIEKVLAIPRYGKFVADTFPSPVQFEAMIRREIGRIEALSKFDSVFGFTYKSAFNDMLRNMTVKEVVDFDSQPRDVVRETLQEKDIKYEVYVDWIDSLNSMLTITRAHPTMTFGELFVRAELETLLQHHEAMAA